MNIASKIHHLISLLILHHICSSESYSQSQFRLSLCQLSRNNQRPNNNILSITPDSYHPSFVPTKNKYHHNSAKSFHLSATSKSSSPEPDTTSNKVPIKTSEEITHDNVHNDTPANCNRRSLFYKFITTTSIASISPFLPLYSSSHNNQIFMNNNDMIVANAAVGTLPELNDTNAVFQGITLNIYNKMILDSMITFLKDGFDFKVLREKKTSDKNGEAVVDIWLGFGPEEMDIPNDFTLPISSFANYGGHASIHIRYDPSITNIKDVTTFTSDGMSTDEDILYKLGDNDPPGDNIAFLQVGVPSYRISQMVRNGGNVLDAYGFVNVISPCGLPMRGIIGISPDPMMFVAINCLDVKKSKTFWEQIGFVQQEYPYCRPFKGTGQFEPPQPKGSVYLAPSKNSMGVLLLPHKKKRSQLTSKNSVQLIPQPNPVLRSFDIVYTPTTTVGTNNDSIMKVYDPSFVPVLFTDYSTFEKEEESTRIKSISE